MTLVEQNSFWPDAVERSGDQRPFRPIHYLGSKLRLLGLISNTLDEVDPGRGRVCDLFAGSGTVSASLAAKRPVTAVDIQEYSRVLCSALLSPHAPSENLGYEISTSSAYTELSTRLRYTAESLIEHESYCLREAAQGRLGPLAELLDAGPIFVQGTSSRAESSSRLRKAFAETTARMAKQDLLDGKCSVVTRYFGGVYFSYFQAVELDGLLAATDHISPFYRDTATAAVISTASDVVNTVGKQFAQPIRITKRNGGSKPHLVAKIIRDRTMPILDFFDDWMRQYSRLPRSARPHRAIRQDYSEFLSAYIEPLNAIYADPPYTRDHYSRYYHVLETMCLRDEPRISVSNLGRGSEPSRGMYRADRHQSPFCIKSQAPKAFESLFVGTRRHNVPLVVSYSPYDKDGGAHPRLMTVEGLLQSARRFYRSVDLISAGQFAHSKLNSADRALVSSEEAEVLLVCRP